jgi:polyphosphate kinase
LINAETGRKAQGHTAWIQAKMNSLADREIIAALYAASRAGVKISLNVRGICCLVPGVKGLSENITVTSIVDRFLEHSRVFCFCNGGGTPAVFISSADMMPRNLDKRIELFTPVDDPECRQRLLEFLAVCFSDNCNAWQLLPDGTWERRKTLPHKNAVRSQMATYDSFNNALIAVRRGPTMFKPHQGRKKRASPAKPIDRKLTR